MKAMFAVILTTVLALVYCSTVNNGEDSTSHVSSSILGFGTIL